MADVTITAADVVASANAQTGEGTAGVAIVAGEWVYRAADKTLRLADANSSLLTSTAEGMALHAAGVGQPLKFASQGEVTVSAVLTTGKVYVVSSNAGKTAPVADLASGWWTSIVGYAKTTSVLVIRRINTGIQNSS